MNLLSDIYYQKKYVELYLKEGEHLFEFTHQSDGQIFYNLTIKRPIVKIGNVSVEPYYYDLETAYGYGGIYSNSEDVEFLQQAVKAYAEHCHQQNIIAEFSRFHPFNQTPKILHNYFNFLSEDRNVVYVDTHIDKQERWLQYSKNTRNILRKCAKNLTFEPCSQLDGFIELYQKTMDKNAADQFYYFDRNYFERLITMPQVDLYNVLFDGKVISSTFFLWGDDFGHYHLSANDYEMRSHNANYFILDTL
ncbi:MAG: femAB family protein, partial [Rhizobiales bacterium]|nr:femAB family protein [Hyphomicrobiales bacterium]